MSTRPSDGILIHTPQAGLVLNINDGRTITLEGGSFHASVKENDIFVYCASNQLSAGLAQKFGAFCVELPDPNVLVRRLNLRAHPTSQLDYGHIVHGNVEYREHTKAAGVDWALPERLALIKGKEFKWQDEYRIVIGKREAMDVENVEFTIGTQPPPHEVRLVHKPIFLGINRLTEAVLHRF